MPQPFVTNAEDPRQVAAAARRAERKHAQFIIAVRKALKDPHTRRVLWQLLYEARVGLAHVGEDYPEKTCSVFSGVRPNLEYNAGRQDIGYLVQGWIRQADPDALVTMAREALAHAARQDAETQALHRQREEEEADEP